MTNKVTNNIYSSWYETVKNKGRGANIQQIKSLEAFNAEEIHHLLWLLNEQLLVIDRKSQDAT